MGTKIGLLFWAPRTVECLRGAQKWVPKVGPLLGPTFGTTFSAQMRSRFDVKWHARERMMSASRSALPGSCRQDSPDRRRKRLAQFRQAAADPRKAAQYDRERAEVPSIGQARRKTDSSCERAAAIPASLARLSQRATANSATSALALNTQRPLSPGGQSTLAHTQHEPVGKG